MERKEKTTRQKQALLTKKRIFDAATELIHEVDFDDITVREICKRSQVSVGTFYLYFKTKYDILLELYRVVDKLIGNAMVHDRTDLQTKEKIILIVRLQMQFGMKTDIKITKQLYSSQLFHDKPIFLSEDRDLYKILNQVIIEGQENKEITDSIDSRAITKNILRFSRGITFEWLIRDGTYDLEEVAINELERYLATYDA